MIEPPKDKTAFALLNPHELAEALPGVYRSAWLDERAMSHDGTAFGERFLSAFDIALAPILASLDSLDAYFDPMTAPIDFVNWLCEWVAGTMDENWEEPRRRAFVRDAVMLHRNRGTRLGLEAHLAIQTGAKVEVADNGGCSWSSSPDSALPGSAEPLMTIKVTVPASRQIDAEQLEAFIAASKPAYVPHRLTIVRANAAAQPAPGA